MGNLSYIIYGFDFVSLNKEKNNKPSIDVDSWRGFGGVGDWNNWNEIKVVIKAAGKTEPGLLSRVKTGRWTVDTALKYDGIPKLLKIVRVTSSILYLVQENTICT